MVDVIFKKYEKDKEDKYTKRIVNIGTIKAGVVLLESGISIAISDKKLADKIQKAIGQVEDGKI